MGPKEVPPADLVELAMLSDVPANAKQALSHLHADGIRRQVYEDRGSQEVLGQIQHILGMDAVLSRYWDDEDMAPFSVN